MAALTGAVVPVADYGSELGTLLLGASKILMFWILSCALT